MSDLMSLLVRENISYVQLWGHDWSAVFEAKARGPVDF